jgi:hypothetical protein
MAPDPRPAQAERAADFMELHPEGVTAPELDAACDLGSATKVLSDMQHRLGYGIGRGWRLVPCAFGNAPRRRRAYFLTHRPQPGRQLALDLEDTACPERP